MFKSIRLGAVRMRGALLFACFGLLAGCVASPDHPTDTSATSTTTVAPLPSPVHQEGDVVASADPLNNVQPSCSSPTAQCVEFPFNLTHGATIDASLTWT